MSRCDRAIAQRLKVWPLLELGLYPIPVNPQTRKPLVPWGAIDEIGYRPGAEAMPDNPELGARLHVGEGLPYESLIFQWWDEHPRAGAAVMTGLSRLLVLDVDPRAGGHHSLARLVAQRPLPATRTVRSRSGGLHLYYRTATLVKSTTGVLGAGLDVKSHRGLVFSPPTPGYSLLERRGIAEAPAWLVRRCGRPAGKVDHPHVKRPFDDPVVQRVVEHAVQKILDAPHGEQHNTIYGQARYAYKHCLDDQVTEALYAAAEEIAPEAWRRPNWERAIADARRKEGGR